MEPKDGPGDDPTGRPEVPGWAHGLANLIIRVREIGKGPLRLFQRRAVIGPIACQLDHWWLDRAARLDPLLEETFDGHTVRFEPSSPAEMDALLAIFNEREVIVDLLARLDEADVFWDVGAHVGVYSCLVGQVVQNGHVVAFEPHPSNADALVHNLELNGVDAVVRREGLSDVEATLDLAMSSAEAGSTHNVLRPEGSGGATLDGGTVQVEVRVGDRVIEEGVPAPTVLKVDVEGAEGAVLRGLTKTLEDPRCALVYMEVHEQHLPSFGDDPKTVEALLTSAGFTIERVMDRRGKYFIRAEKGGAAIG